jgi:hypothetical protein
MEVLAFDRVHRAEGDGASHATAVTGVARMARISVRSGSLRRSVAGFFRSTALFERT